jgi:hypothetical protein
MHGFDEFEHDDAGVVFRDLITLALCGFIACVVLMLPHINAARAARTADGGKTPGNVVIEASWPPELDTDVDLWVQGPGDVPVGYSNKSGGLFNLLRDDLGHVMDVSGLNYESSYARGVLPGEYVVNLHLYRNVSGRLPVPVKVVVSSKPDADGPMKQILFSDALLGREGEELTVFRFRLDGSGRLVAGSVGNLQKPLRSGAKS